MASDIARAVRRRFTKPVANGDSLQFLNEHAAPLRRLFNEALTIGAKPAEFRSDRTYSGPDAAKNLVRWPPRPGFDKAPSS
jgi:hypothetical protein